MGAGNGRVQTHPERAYWRTKWVSWRWGKALSETIIAILGGGPMGLALAHYLLEHPGRKHSVHVFERQPVVGGLSGSFLHRGIHFDFGSHRLHPAAGERVLADIGNLLGSDLLLRPRAGRIRLDGRFVGYPLRPLDLVRNLSPRFAFGFACDALLSSFRRNAGAADSYASALSRALGPTMTESFYFPYARKLWGLPVEELAADQASRRVSAASLAKMLRRLLAAVPGLSTGMSGQAYYYPKRGFGQICTALERSVVERGGHVHFGARVGSIRVSQGRATGLRLRTGSASTVHSVDTTQVFSTIPLTELASISPWFPPAIRSAAGALRYRAMIYCYLVLRTSQFTPYDAHYFPESTVSISRLSEPKNYSAASEPRGLTGLCGEIPCWRGDDIWALPDGEIAAQVLADLEKAGLPVTQPVEEILVRRQTHAYPVYDLDYAKNLLAVEEHVASIPGLVTLGRQGLFAHDNIHHAFAMAQTAGNCLNSDGSWDARGWSSAREGFREHVVVD